LKAYTLLDLGCGYGRLAPLLTAFDCTSYLGVDRVFLRILHAERCYGRGFAAWRGAVFLARDVLELGPGGRGAGVAGAPFSRRPGGPQPMMEQP
ncbi:hypothetical protein LCGC14_2826030, partial [marine sediment metagenome]